MNRRISGFPNLKAVLFTATYLIITIALYSQNGKELVLGEQPVYKVSKTGRPFTADGKMDEPDWKKAEVQSLNYFFRSDKPADKQQSKFRMLWDDQNLYLFYEFEDSSLTSRETAYDARPYLDDCAEFFCLPVPDSLYMHYGFEVNVTLARYDYIMLWEFYNKRNFFLPDYNPEYQVGVTHNGTINNDKDRDKGWTMEFIIPLKVFRNFPRPRVGSKWAFQAVRQDRNLVDDKFRSTSTLFPTYDVKKDVHPPNRFGLMEFVGE
jgi:hypothetical protein